MPNSSQIRSRAIRDSINRVPHRMDIPKDDLGRILPVSEYFGSNALSVSKIVKSLNQEEADRLKELVENHRGILDKEFADKIAKIVKDWAIDHGITHFCHWFQPMTGSTAEKHDAFIAFDADGEPIEQFSGEQLRQSEPDASSFPSGGMRATFEARGYTAWDVSSPIFITEGVNGKTLCIPSVFISYHGDALDEKGPLLRSVNALNKASVEAMSLLGNNDVAHVTPTLGAEQEYFLIDKSFFSLRPDLMLSGRTLIGARPPKGQELEDHYFGSVPVRVTAFMQEVEYELYKLGVPAKTRHNEVAPSQFEIAAIFRAVNVAVDHNHLIMETLRRVAKKHDFALLLHEKPFAGVNGSGKHANWALSTDKGENIFEPGNTPHQNLRFLYFLGATMKAVHRHNGLLRASIASAGNDHRLGANEAPPAIVSVFLGEELTGILNKIKTGEEIDNAEKAMIDMGLSEVAQIRQDKTDRNRTSPFAFTGNKFEFRAVGSSATCAWPMTCLNGAMAESLRELNTRLKEKFASQNDKEQAVLELVREVIIESEPVRFEGDNYSEEWLSEAEKRGLKHLKNTAVALETYNYDETKKMFSELGILHESELESRLNVQVDRYNKKIDIECEAMRTLMDVYIEPAASLYTGEIARSAANTKHIIGEGGTQDKLVKRMSKLLKELHDKRDKFEDACKAANKTDDEHKRSLLLADKVLPAMEDMREVIDRIECVCADTYWPLPKYREMLFLS